MKPIVKKKQGLTECGDKLFKTYRTVELCGICNKTIPNKYFKYCGYCGEKIERV